MKIHQLSVFVENKPGRLIEVTRAMADANIDIRALSIADTSDFGILRLIVDRPEEAVASLREAQFTVSLTEVIAVAMDDTPGSFHRVVKLLGDQGVDIEYMYAFLSRCDQRAYLILRVEDTSRAVSVLKDHGVEMLSAEEVYHL